MKIHQQLEQKSHLYICDTFTGVPVVRVDAWDSFLMITGILPIHQLPRKDIIVPSTKKKEAIAPAFGDFQKDGPMVVAKKLAPITDEYKSQCVSFKNTITPVLAKRGEQGIILKLIDFMITRFAGSKNADYLEIHMNLLQYKKDIQSQTNTKHVIAAIMKTLDLWFCDIITGIIFAAKGLMQETHLDSSRRTRIIDPYSAKIKDILQLNDNIGTYVFMHNDIFIFSDDEASNFNYSMSVDCDCCVLQNTRYFQHSHNGRESEEWKTVRYQRGADALPQPGDYVKCYIETIEKATQREHHILNIQPGPRMFQGTAELIFELFESQRFDEYLNKHKWVKYFGCKEQGKVVLINSLLKENQRYKMRFKALQSRFYRLQKSRARDEDAGLILDDDFLPQLNEEDVNDNHIINNQQQPQELHHYHNHNHNNNNIHNNNNHNNNNNNQKARPIITQTDQQTPSTTPETTPSPSIDSGSPINGQSI